MVSQRAPPEISENWDSFWDARLDGYRLVNEIRIMPQSTSPLIRKSSQRRPLDAPRRANTLQDALMGACLHPAR